MKLSPIFFAVFALGTCGVAFASDVSTIAGSGAAGYADGPAQKATFLLPAGLARAANGTIYISDMAAQRIRELTPSMQVRTIAGSGQRSGSELSVPGGYRDGPALRAQFNGPEGLALGSGGALYIADSFNSCVRKLVRGMVSVVAGKCGEPGDNDGTAASARLNRPRGIAFDGEGNLYIADDGVGLRELAKNGNVTTIRFKNYLGTSALGVDVTGASSPLVILATADGLVTYDPVTKKDENLGALKSSVPSQVAGIDRRQFIFTDLLSHDIRYVRIPQPPFAGQLIRPFAGHASERGIDNAGFADGSLQSARFYDPMGIVLAGNRAIVADAGNRRIRSVLLPPFRVTETGFDAASKSDSSHYEVALVGASWTFWDAFANDAICAQIERTLDSSGRFHKPVRCHTVTIDGAESLAMEDYIKNVFQYQHMDLVILDAESWSYNLPGARVEGNITFAQLFRNRMRSLLNFLTPLKTRLALVWIYPAQITSDAEWIMERTPGAFRAIPTDNYHRISTQMEQAIKGLPIMQYDMYNDVVRYELSPGALPLYRSNDQHPNPRGNAFFGAHFAQALLNQGLGKP